MVIFELCVIFFSLSLLSWLAARSRSFVEKVYERSGGGCWQQLTERFQASQPRQPFFPNLAHEALPMLPSHDCPCSPARRRHTTLPPALSAREI
jgi:hypothetical protein